MGKIKSGQEVVVGKLNDDSENGPKKSPRPQHHQQQQRRQRQREQNNLMPLVRSEKYRKQFGHNAQSGTPHTNASHILSWEVAIPLVGKVDGQTQDALSKLLNSHTTNLPLKTRQENFSSNPDSDNVLDLEIKRALIDINESSKNGPGNKEITISDAAFKRAQLQVAHIKAQIDERTAIGKSLGCDRKDMPAVKTGVRPGTRNPDTRTIRGREMLGLAPARENGLCRDGITPHMGTKKGRELSQQQQERRLLEERTKTQQTSFEEARAAERESRHKDTERIRRQKEELRQKEAAEQQRRRQEEAERKARRAEEKRRQQARQLEERRKSLEAGRLANDLLQQQKREDNAHRQQQQEWERERQRRHQEVLRQQQHHQPQRDPVIGYHQSNGCANGRELHRGPRGGIYYVNSSGKKQYVNRK